MQSHIQNALHVRRKEHRQTASLENMVTLVGGSRALADVVIAGNGNHAAVARGAGHVGVLEHIAAAIDAWPLAIPNAKDTVVFFALRVQVELLGTPDSGSAQLFIHTRLKDHVVSLQMLLRSDQCLVVST